MKFVVVMLVLPLVAVLMTMAGHGGGNFYVLTLVLAGIPMHQAAMAAQFILFATATAAMIVFGRHKVVSWQLVFFIGGLTASGAFIGGFCAYGFSGVALKLIFSAMLIIAAVLMLLPIREQPVLRSGRFGYWRLRTSTATYMVNLWFVVPVTLGAGFFAGMVGVSGGSLLVPLMVLACRVPMRVAVGTASAMIAATALMGFLGHVIHAGFNPSWILPLAAVTVVGGIVGGSMTLKVKPKYLKVLFALIAMVAAVLMIAKTLL
ncbi:MAG: hypothetical protein B1H03_05910 [Planctomycetales bacterium 4484_113]|nr:MAG: hypothetical protein B1H03_05910 [Planctomycetales bacterium 4484_113]